PPPRPCPQVSAAPLERACAPPSEVSPPTEQKQKWTMAPRTTKRAGPPREKTIVEMPDEYLKGRLTERARQHKAERRNSDWLRVSDPNLWSAWGRKPAERIAAVRSG